MSSAAVVTPDCGRSGVTPVRHALSPSTLEWVLRAGAFLCFAGHGAFGIITKQQWLPYFSVAGIEPRTAYELMPIIGVMDVTMGCVMLIRPAPIVACWMIVWGIWTALLRPLSGEPIWEMVERAGNYGVPAVFALLMPFPRSVRNLLCAVHLRPLTPEILIAARRLLTATVVLLLLGHGALGALGKHGLAVNYASVLPAETATLLTPYLGWLEIALAAAVAVWQEPAALVAVAGWKIATEALFVTAGAPIWEVVERGGSYVAPLALALVVAMIHRRANEDALAAPMQLPSSQPARQGS